MGVACPAVYVRDRTLRRWAGPTECRSSSTHGLQLQLGRTPVQDGTYDRWVCRRRPDSQKLNLDLSRLVYMVASEAMMDRRSTPRVMTRQL